LCRTVLGRLEPMSSSSHPAHQRVLQVPNPFSCLPAAFAAFSHADLHAQIQCMRACDMSPELQAWAFQLCKTNMEALYNACSWGWEDRAKRSELFDPAARFLVAFSKNDATKPLAYLHFR